MNYPSYVAVQELKVLFDPYAQHAGLCNTHLCIHCSKNLLIPIRDELQTISEDSSSDLDARAKAGGFLKVINQFEFYVMLLVAEIIFEITDRLSKILQDSTISACDGMKAAEYVIAELKKSDPQSTSVSCGI